MNKYHSPAYFLSDCHLPLIPRPGQEEWTPTVVRFLRKIASDARTLFIVGDLFDFWFEWRYSVPSAAFPILTELSNLRKKNIDIIYIAGNHDGHLGNFLKNEVDLTISREPIDVEIDSRKFHIIHGDGIAKSDHGYRILRGLVRWKMTEKIYKLVHPDLGIWFARCISKHSRITGGNPKAGRLEYYTNYADRKLDSGFNFVVMGHIHEAKMFPHHNGGFFSIGEWMKKHSYGVFKEDEMELEFFEE
ncbi:MAG: UDP-2,3-diacylglucosamine diphosphatase [Candidatus Hatepunaea meridiana]|nr:UDP-2,3-diacylglucosamine diphosphatase [Candidatus Hatepunaea meridiana]